MISCPAAYGHATVNRAGINQNEGSRFGSKCNNALDNLLQCNIHLKQIVDTVYSVDCHSIYLEESKRLMRILKTGTVHYRDTSDKYRIALN